MRSKKSEDGSQNKNKASSEILTPDSCLLTPSDILTPGSCLLTPSNLILCGLQASGKTTIGKLVAMEMNYDFVDTDRLIENEYEIEFGHKLTCRQICQQKGENIFRDLEKKQIESLRHTSSSVIALGGGSFLNDRGNVFLLQSIGRIVYLKASVDILWKRILQNGIPAYLAKEDPERAFQELANKREPFYENAASEIVETDRLSLQDIVALIYNRFFYHRGHREHRENMRSVRIN